MRHATNYCWRLDKECPIEAWRKGFPPAPNFSSAIDSALGRTPRAAVPDPVGEYCPPWHSAAFKGCVALSRVREADGPLVAPPFSPLLFQMGARPWPSLLFDLQRGRVSFGALDDKCEQAAKESKSTKLLRHATWGRCERGSDEEDWRSLFELHAKGRADPN